MTADLGRAIEREAVFLAEIPSYRGAIALDRAQRWDDAASLYRQALAEVGTAMNLDARPLWESAAFKIDLERRRSQALARDGVQRDHRAADQSPRPGGDGLRGNAQAALPPLERGRLLRMKMMSVRAAMGAAPVTLMTAAIAALQAAVTGPPGPKAGGPPTPAGSRATTTTPPTPTPTPTPASASPSAAPAPPLARGGDPEARLLLCATRAAGGDPAGARHELAQVSPGDRTDPVHALALATCQASLRDDAEALASLAVAVYRLGPSSRFLPGQTQELQAANDWDILRLDPRFDLIFR